jgi:pilus assembly protein CpaE
MPDLTHDTPHREYGITSVADPAPYAQSFARPAGPRPISGKRIKFVGFANDEASATLLHNTLSVLLPDSLNQVHVVDFRTSLTLLAAMKTPEIILVDLSGEEQPINAMLELAEVVEPGTTVLAIGEIQNLTFYRTVTKGMGVREYLPKPLTIESVERIFIPIIADLSKTQNNTRLGRDVALSGARGGVGTSTIATNLAWYISSELHRHTALVDADLQTGTVGLNLNLNCNKSLSVVFEAPERLDNLLVERSTQPAGERLHVLAAQEPLDQQIDYKPGSAALLTKTLRGRYNFIISDAGNRLLPLGRELLCAAQHRVIVMDPTIISLRNAKRLLALDDGTMLPAHSLLVLNRATMPGALSQAEMETSLGRPFIAVIPDLPRIVPRSTHAGTAAAALRGPFRTAISTLAAALGAATPAEAA